MLGHESKVLEATTMSSLDKEIVWIVIFATLAECCSSCFVFESIDPTTQLNISATSLNLFGAFLEGWITTFEQVVMDEGKRKLGRLFRCSFLGVLTSYSYMTEHAAFLATKNPSLGPIYIIGSLVLSCIAFALGRLTYLSIQPVSMKKQYSTHFPKVFYSSVILIFLILIRAIFGPKGFVRDPNDPQYIGNYQIHDGVELILGIVFSSTAILLSRVIGREKPTHMTIDWGTWRCNLSAILLSLAAWRWFPSNFILFKFITSFCGSLSCFSATIEYTMNTRASNVISLLNLGLNGLTAVIFVPYFQMRDRG